MAGNDWNDDNAPGSEDSPLKSVLSRNIGALHQRQTSEAAEASLEDRLAETITAFSGSMAFVYAHLALVIGWVLANLEWIPGVRPFDPTFVILATIASVEAIFLSTFVLISQNRAAASARRQEQLNLQTSLLSEHEITRLLKLTVAIAKHLDIKAADDPELGEMERNIAPERVLDEINTKNDKP